MALQPPLTARELGPLLGGVRRWGCDPERAPWPVHEIQRALTLYGDQRVVGTLTAVAVLDCHRLAAELEISLEVAADRCGRVFDGALEGLPFKGRAWPVAKQLVLEVIHDGGVDWVAPGALADLTVNDLVGALALMHAVASLRRLRGR